MFFRTLVLDLRSDSEISSNDGRVHVDVGRTAGKWRMLTDKVKVVEIAADIVPKPTLAAIENDTVLFAVVVVRLAFSP